MSSSSKFKGIHFFVSIENEWQRNEGVAEVELLFAAQRKVIPVNLPGEIHGERKDHKHPDAADEQGIILQLYNNEDKRIQYCKDTGNQAGELPRFQDGTDVPGNQQQGSQR